MFISSGSQIIVLTKKQNKNKQTFRDDAENNTVVTAINNKPNSADFHVYLRDNKK